MVKQSLLAGLLLAFLAPPATAEEVLAAAASDLSFVLPELAARFEKENGHTLKLTFGSSGNLFSQIENGAPFDLFFSADLDYPRRLEAAGRVEPGTFYLYANGCIVLWVSNGSGLNLGQGLRALLDPAVRKIAIANPRHAPYGRAAVAALQHEKIYESVARKLVFGENISQAAQFVESGNADAGILALSLAIAPAMKSKGRYFPIPRNAHPPIEQALVILKSSHRKQAAQQFLQFLKKPESIALLHEHGFYVAESRK